MVLFQCSERYRILVVRNVFLHLLCLGIVNCCCYRSFVGKSLPTPKCLLIFLFFFTVFLVQNVICRSWSFLVNEFESFISIYPWLRSIFLNKLFKPIFFLFLFIFLWSAKDVVYWYMGLLFHIVFVFLPKNNWTVENVVIDLWFSSIWFEIFHELGNQPIVNVLHHMSLLVANLGFWLLVELFPSVLYLLILLYPSIIDLQWTVDIQCWLLFFDWIVFGVDEFWRLWWRSDFGVNWWIFWFYTDKLTKGEFVFVGERRRGLFFLPLSHAFPFKYLKSK